MFDIHSYFGAGLIPGTANSPAAVTAAMEERAVDEAVLMSNHARYVDPLAGNRILRKVVEHSPKLHGCVITHVNRVDSSVSAMREQMGMRKFVAMAIAPSRRDEPVTKIVADEIINAYRRYSKPLFLYTPNAAYVQAALEIARGYPALKVVFLGMGGADWRTAIVAAHTSTNVMLETSGALDRAKLPAAVEAIGAHRILFGSGTPRVDAAAAAGLIEDSALSDDARRKILIDNARRLFRLDADSEPPEED